MSELRQQFLEGMSCVAATVTIVTTDGPTGRAGVTVSAMSSVSADTAKPTLLVCVNQASAGAAPILSNGAFCVNILRDDQSVVSDTFAGRFGDKGEAKFDCGHWTAGETGSPMLDGALVSFDCRLADQLRVGTHHVLFGEVQQVRFSGPARALVYANRAYGTLLKLPAAMPTGGTSGHVRVACLSSFAPFYLPGLLSRMRAEHPNIDIDVREGDQAQVLEMLDSGEADLALAYERSLPATLQVSTLTSLAPYVIVPADHTLAHREAVTLADLAGEPMILLDAPLSRDYFSDLYTSAGLSPNIALRTPSFEMLRGLGAHGLGYSLLVTRPQNAVAYDGTPIVALPLADPNDPIGIALVSRMDSALSDGSAIFAANCRRHFKKFVRG